MEIILSQDVDKIGKAGTVVKVKDGFARNFLIPNGLAVAATPLALKKQEDERKKKAVQLEKLKSEAEKVKDRLTGLSLTIPVLAQDEDKLYAGINEQNIAGALKEEGFDIDKDSVIMPDPIKSLGIFEVSIKLHPEVVAAIKVWIVKK